jgi:hypothetical protein
VAKDTASRFGEVAVRAPPPEAWVNQHITTSDACANVPVAGHVYGDEVSLVMFAGLASSGDVANGPSITAATATALLVLAVAAIETPVNVPAFVTRE